MPTSTKSQWPPVATPDVIPASRRSSSRTALAASLAFLTANDYTIDVTNDELFALTIIVARNEMPEAALIAESFTPRLRYSGCSLGYQLASILAGGPAPIIATALFARYHSGYAIAVFIAATFENCPSIGSVTPRSCNARKTSSVGTFPTSSFCAKGQPPSPPMVESKRRHPAS